MKKKLLILGLAGTLLFSGLSVFAAVNDDCGHPSYTKYVAPEYRNWKECPDPTHVGCKVCDQYTITTIECHYCFRRFIVNEKFVGEHHTFYESN